MINSKKTHESNPNSNNPFAINRREFLVAAGLGGTILALAALFGQKTNKDNKTAEPKQDPAMLMLKQHMMTH